MLGFGQYELKPGTRARCDIRLVSDISQVFSPGRQKMDRRPFGVGPSSRLVLGLAEGPLAEGFFNAIDRRVHIQQPGDIVFGQINCRHV